MKSMAWLVLMAVTLGAHAGEEESTPCDNVETDQQSQACALFSRQTAERELGAAFDELVQRIRDQYPDEGDKVADLTGRLQAAEKLWTGLRDADCKVETYAEKAGTKAFEAAWNTCVAQRSDDRSEYLQSIGQQ
ncbi:MAG TPA: lysozyme inhibitor LprI family protein [Pseudomonas sp.]|uniref:lysozyme inhibitor LprI family protein n=1 Tax=Pseudomonas sp. TaxID=306 RepID=UPI002B4644B3|nr:lysozyme inhibitor LprI family protein [Pseudomonas sp.]HKS13079.1 lysozyme inhibitor LprI family protein [Pseudomonas sp.]